MLCVKTATQSNRILHLLCYFPSIRNLLQIQAQIITNNLCHNTEITSQFFRVCESLNSLIDALEFFLQIHRPHVFLCNTLIRAFSRSKSPQNSIAVFINMLRDGVSANNFTFPFVIKACSDHNLVFHGLSIHTHIVKTGHHANDLYIQNSLLDFYCSCGDFSMTRKLFDEMPQRDIVSWTSLISGYANNGRSSDALFLFKTMLLAGLIPNVVTLVNVLSACAQSGELWIGTRVHEFIRKEGFELDVILGTSLINMYAKCAKIELAMQVFRSMPEKNVFTWNALINGLATADSGERALSLFQRMEEEGISPDEVTLIGVLCACSHAGLVQEGRWIFKRMLAGEFRISPGIKHYGCMVDLLSRAGFTEEAYEFAKGMPFKPNTIIWGALLNGSKAHGDLRVSEVAARKLVELEPWNGAYMAVLSRLYVEMGRWSNAEKLRAMMKRRKVVKDPGCSLLIHGGSLVGHMKSPLFSLDAFSMGLTLTNPG